ncbi:MAG TPA: class I SAM-dependent methyltransferase [Thermoanaerobaculia bacterium]|jgi:SAM-dependent methyltransferase
MNANLPGDHISIHYYDSDYPGRDTSRIPENFDGTTVVQGLAHDVDRYLELAGETPGGRVLELCCGTGRVSIPLARGGFRVTGVDLSAAMLDRFRENLGREAAEVAARISLVHADIARLDLGETFALALIPFNSLLCLTRFEDQCAALAAAARHLAPGGRLAVDVMNPLTLPLEGSPIPNPFLTRRNPHTGNVYTRFAALGPMAADQVQELFGWYDEIGPDGNIRRIPYSMHWRPIFRYELELMLERAGLAVESVEGGHLHEPFTAQSSKLFVVARKA